jgi:DNA-binding beta-propeller fold protein YncE
MMLRVSLAFLTGALIAAGPASAAPAYRLVKAVPLGTPDRWDYVVADAKTRRVYVAHGDRLTVVDAASGDIVGNVEGIAGGTHGTAVSLATGEGFTDDGRGGVAVAFNLKTLAVTKRIPAAADADGIVRDGATGHIFIIEGDPATVTVIDPKTDTAIATIPGGEKLEYGAADDAGSIYVAGEEKGDLVKIDARSNKVVAHWPAAGCSSPHGLAVDRASRRAFLGCANAVMAVMDTDNGRVVATLPIGRGNDAVAFDPKRRRVFSSNGADGTVSVFQQETADRYQPLEPITTKVSGRTMGVDASSGRVFVAAADTDPSATPGGRRRPRPGTLSLLIFDPID